MAGRNLPDGTDEDKPQRHQHYGGHGSNHQEQNYRKGGGGRHGTLKEVHEEGGEHFRMTGGGQSGENSGPTGSSRSYPKRGREMAIVHHTDWNPMLLEPSTYGICGVDGKD